MNYQRHHELPTTASDGSSVVYREAPNHPDYRVGSDGSIWSRRRHGTATFSRLGWLRMKRTRQIIDPFSGKTYLAVRLARDVEGGTRQTWFHVHRLVLAAFVGPCPEGMEACHENDDGTDSRLCNLRWDTRKANAEDAVRNGRILRGSDQPQAKLTELEVTEIWRLHLAGARQCDLARRFRVSEASIRNILAGRRWKHVTADWRSQPEQS